MSDIEWVVGETYVRRDGKLTILICDLRIYESFTKGADDLKFPLEFLDEAGFTNCCDIEGKLRFNNDAKQDVIKRYEPEKSKSDKVDEFVDNLLKIFSLKSNELGYVCLIELKKSIKNLIEDE